MLYNMRRLTESEDVFALMKKHQPVDELQVWAKSNMPDGYMNAGDLSRNKNVKINGIDIKELDSNVSRSIAQWIGNGWWSQADWNAYNVSKDPRDFYDIKKYPKQIGPNSFRIKAPIKYVEKWGIPPIDGHYEVEITDYARSSADDVADEVYDFLMGVSEQRGMTREKFNNFFQSEYGNQLANPGVRQGVKDWNSQWKGFQINLTENKERSMRLTKRQLKRIIREEYTRLKRRGLIREYYDGDDDNAAFDNYDACVQRCFAAIPPMMKQICKMGMAHTVTNDIYHICKPICDEMGCDCDAVSEEVEEMCNL